MLLELLKPQHSDVETTESEPAKRKITLLVSSDSDYEIVHPQCFGLLPSRAFHQHGCTTTILEDKYVLPTYEMAVKMPEKEPPPPYIPA